eukprot:2093510-Rhodomonas_salina.2
MKAPVIGTDFAPTRMGEPVGTGIGARAIGLMLGLCEALVLRLAASAALPVGDFKLDAPLAGPGCVWYCTISGIVPVCTMSK